MINRPYDDKPTEYLTVKTALENRAEQIGNRPFLFYGPDDITVTFRELNDLSNAIANSLGNLGITKQENISVMMENPLKTLYAMFGINKCGAVFSPINFDYKGEALRYQLNDSRPEVLFIDDKYLERIQAIEDSIEPDFDIIVVDTGSNQDLGLDGFSRYEFEDLLNGDSDNPEVDLRWDDTAGILYTSGTTGMPKGVVLSNRWIFGNYSLLRQAMFSEDDVVHVPIPLYHVGGTYWEVMSALIAGASVSLWDQFSTDDFWNRIDKYDATAVTLISTMHSWLHNNATEPTRANTLNKVQMVPLPPYYEEMAQTFGFDIVSSIYGSTEAGAPLAGVIHAAQGEHATPDDLQRGTGADEVIAAMNQLNVPVVDRAPEEKWLGKPRTDLFEVSVVDEMDEEIPPGGDAGELVVRSKSPGIMMKEYLNKPQKTVDATRNFWYHTTDAVVRDEDGFYYFVDRLDDVIRRRGENISSLQVEDIIGSHDDVVECAVFPVPAKEGGEDEVAAAIQTADGSDLNADDLRAFFDREMPEFMHPKFIEFVDEIPTTETNKKEKYKLREQYSK